MSRMTPYALMLVGSIVSSLLFAAQRSAPMAGASSARSAASRAQADRFRPRSGMRGERPRRHARGYADGSAHGFRQPDQRLRSPGARLRDAERGQRRRAALLQRQPLHLRGRRGRRGRPRADLQRPELPRVPPERGHRRREPGRGTPHGPARAERSSSKVARRLADPVARDPSRHRRARGLRGRRPHLPHLDQHARRRLRRGHRQRNADRHPRCAAGGDARDGRAGARARGRRQRAHRPLRLEVPAREPASPSPPTPI